MKTYPRLILGVLSSILLTVGLVRAANVVDPLSQELSDANPDASFKAAATCIDNCDYVDDER